PIRTAFVIGLAGVLGVIVAAPLVTYVNPEVLRWLLLLVVLYNVTMLWKTYRNESSSAPSVHFTPHDNKSTG
ncbi:MAG: hypothetical protein KDH94_08360, partial [Coxiellaceae bacterium]|nr:hypothetical protein [Coxiellaceae bacterium]